MSKELPFFKFYPSEWLIGKISFQPLDIQGAFTQCCCMYWQLEGQMKRDDINFRIGDSLLSRLEDLGFVKSDEDGFLAINFLEEQLSNFDEIREKRRISGARGGISKAKNNLASGKQTLASGKQNLPEKSKRRVREEKEVDKRREDITAEKSAGVFNSCKIWFISFYSEKFGSEYYFTAKDGAKLSSLIKQITFKVEEKEKNSGQKEIDGVIRGFQLFVTEAQDKSDNWIKSNFSLTTLESKFNEIFTQLKNKPASKVEILQQKYAGVTFQP